MRTSMLCAAAVAAASLVGQASASQLLMQSRLADHPDGNAAPPQYGLRIDNLFSQNNAGQALVGGQSGTTTFSFNAPGANVIIQVFDDTNDNVADRVHISGVAYGGRDNGGSYGVGAGFYAIDYTYTANVGTTAEGWDAARAGATNGGTITALTGAFAGESWSMTDKNSGNRSFHFESDNHRLGGSSLDNSDVYVGRGWHMLDNGVMGTQDFLFVAIPLPTTGMLAGAGMLAVAGVRRRRMA
ncbi:MAG: small multi-drug export protein [Phycisphaerales bacterium]